MNYRIERNYRNNDALRHSFNELAVKTFGLDFEQWYQNGFWNEKYDPYSIIIDGTVVSNVSVNLIDCLLNGERKRYIQLGTVMTDKAYQNNGYCRILMEAVLHDYENCNGFFLFANDTVLDFYPKFGFHKMPEYRFYIDDIHGTDYSAKHIPMKTSSDWAEFLKEKNKRTSNGIIRLNTDGLTMFYLTQYMQNDVYYIKPLDAYVIAKIENNALILYGVFSSHPVDIPEICGSFGNSVSKAELAFVPENTNGLKRYEYKEPNTTFFVRGSSLIQDLNTFLSFPEIAHA